VTLSLVTPLAGTVIQMYQNETSPSLTDQMLLSDGSTVDCSGGTVSLRARLMGGTAYAVNGTALLVSGGTAGSVQYNWGTADVTGQGEYAAWWYVQTSAGTLSSAEFMLYFDAHSTRGVNASFGNVRSSMSDLIELSRRKIGDARGPNQQFTDAEIQQSLDQYRSYAHPRNYPAPVGYQAQGRYEQLVAEPQYLPGGTVAYTQYESCEEYWEADAVTVDGAYGTVTAGTVDYLSGVWQFAAGTAGTGQQPPVYATGKTYDLYRACGDLLMEWAAQTALQFDVSAGGRAMSLQQKTQRLEQLADRCYGRAKPSVGVVERSDLVPSHAQDGHRFRRAQRGY
jgi:hypothetical protein